MANITTFPTMHDVLVAGTNLYNMTCGAAVKAGMVVAVTSDGTVVPAVAGALTHSIGVALYDAAAGQPVAIAGVGCIAYAANADDTTMIGAGSRVESNPNTVGGTINAVNEAATGGALATAHPHVVGYALDNIPGGGTGRILILPHAYTQENTM